MVGACEVVGDVVGAVESVGSNVGAAERVGRLLGCKVCVGSKLGSRDRVGRDVGKGVARMTRPSNESTERALAPALATRRAFAAGSVATPCEALRTVECASPSRIVGFDVSDTSTTQTEFDFGPLTKTSRSAA